LVGSVDFIAFEAGRLQGSAFLGQRSLDFLAADSSSDCIVLGSCDQLRMTNFSFLGLFVNHFIVPFADGPRKR
jgi:hypothetical protein